MQEISLQSQVLKNLNISDTICDPAHVEALPALTVDEPLSA